MKRMSSMLLALVLAVTLLLTGCGEIVDTPTVITTDTEDETPTTVFTEGTTVATESVTTTTVAPTTTTKKVTVVKPTTTKKKITTTTKKATTTKKKVTTTKKPTTTTKKLTTTTKIATTTKRVTTTTRIPVTTIAASPAPKTYGLNETWKCAAGFEVTVTKAERHGMCSDSYDDLKTDNAVLLHYTYKNTGYQTKFAIDKWDFEVYDAQGMQGEAVYFGIYCDHGSGVGSTVLTGGTGSAILPVALVNDGSTVTAMIDIDGNMAMFTVPVVDPPESEEEKPEDKWQGCTFTLDAALPETYHYYTGYGDNQSIQSSCIVNEVRFEVSGDDLDIYFSGRKTYDSRGEGQSDACKISWKLYEDETNTVIANGTAYTLGLAMGEAFRDCDDTAYDCIEAGKSYTLKLLNTN